MILQSLVEYYECLAEQGKVSKPGWCKAKVAFALMIKEDGRLFGILPLRKMVEKGKKQVVEPELCQVPEMVSRSSGVSANFLCDNSKYILGIDKNGTSKRNNDCFLSAKEKHLSILQEVNSPCARAVKAFFSCWNPEEAQNHPDIREIWDDITAGGNLIFYVDGIYAQDDLEISRQWQKRHTSSSTGQMGTCLVTGQTAEIARIHTVIKGVAGAQSSGAALVSFNAPAFESYGKEQSFNSPVSNYAVFAYTTALNYLLSQRDYAKQIGDITVVFWAEDAKTECQDIFLAMNEASVDNQELLKGIFDNLEKKKAIDIDAVTQAVNLEQKFYILGLSPNAARLSVRFFYMDNFGRMLQNLKKHYERMNIVRPTADKLEYIGLWRLMQETINKKSKDKKPQANISGRTWQAILADGRYPEALYSAVLTRIRAEQDDKDSYSYKISRGRVAIIKAYLLKNYTHLDEKGEDFVGLNEHCENIAYILGREFSVLEEIQKLANPSINTTIKDRYFNSACATPGIIFPVLFKLHINHIGKCEGWKKRKCQEYEDLLVELEGKLPSSGCPKRLTLEEQGLFILGYYHQEQTLIKNSQTEQQNKHKEEKEDE